MSLLVILERPSHTALLVVLHGGGTVFVESFFRLVRRLFVLLATLTLLAIAAWHGFFDPMLAVDVQAEMRLVGRDAIRLYHVHKQAVDIVVWALGILGPASWLIVKWLMLLDRRLPTIIDRYLARLERRLVVARRKLLETVSGIAPTTGWLRPLFFSSPLDRALSSYGFGNAKTTEPTLVQVVRDIDEKLRIAENHLAVVRLQKATAHVLSAAIALDKASQTGIPVASQLDWLGKSEASLSEAISTRTNDLDALELRAMVRRRLNNTSGAIADLDAIRKSATADENIVRAAGACRNLAEMSILPNTTQARNNARIHLDDGIRLLEDLHRSRALNSIERLELVRLHHQAAGLFTTMRRPQLRAQQISRGLKCGEGLTNDEAQRLLRELKDWQRDANNTRKDDDADERESDTPLK
jgi:hypothetical protein